MMGVSAEMIMAVAALFTAGGGGWKSFAEARKLRAEAGKMSREMEAISSQVHNNHGSSMKDGIDRIEKRVESLDKNVSQMREDLSVAARRTERIENESHESHKAIYRRIERLEDRDKRRNQ